jgi:hypothetical protein
MRQIGLEPDPWQAEVLRGQSKRVLMLCARQTGKSQVAAAMALYEALYHPGALILLLSPTLRQSQELFKKVMAFYQTADLPMVAPEHESALRMELPNGARVISLPGTEETIRGYSGARLLVIDEAARVDDGLYFAVRPMLAVSRGRMVCLTTPFGKRGFFYTEWTSDRAWSRTKIVASECPRISPEFLAEELAVMGQWWWNQEYACNPPQAPIWMGDFSSQPIGDVHPGDTVIGWGRPGPKRFLARTNVIGVARRHVPICEVRMASGGVICFTPDHRWLTMSAETSTDHYVPARIGKRLVRVVSPTQPLPAEMVRDPDTVMGIKPVGESEVVSLQTGTGNYIVWGYASKNCEFMDVLDQAFPTEFVMKAFTSEATPLFGGAPAQTQTEIAAAVASDVSPLFQRK